MKLYDLKTGLAINKVGSALSVALGNFDGVHIGHKKLIETAVKSENKSCVFTFSQNTSNSPAIYSQKDKLSLLCDLGVDYALVCDFDEVRDLSPCEFADKILFDVLDTKTAVCGFNFRYGKNAEGNAHTLKETMENKGGTCVIADKVTLDGESVSSSAIRTLLKSGEIEKANRMLGQNFFITHRVTHGNGYGKTFGYPTVNHKKEENEVSLSRGVYITKCNGKSSVTNVGVRPTVTDENGEYYETYILDYEGDLYDQEVKVEFFKKLRDEIKFDSKDALINQIENDVTKAKEFFK